MSNFKLDGRTIGIIALVVIAAVILLPRLLGNNDTTTPTADNPPVNVNPRDTTVNDEDNIELGRVVTAAGVDRDGCPSDTTSTFSRNEPVYVIAEDSDVAAGTEVFVRWYLDNQVYEESDAITADQDYENACIAFNLEPDASNALRSGDYEAEFIINGNPADTVSFEVQ